jgi:hypothetical protein
MHQKFISGIYDTLSFAGGAIAGVVSFEQNINLWQHWSDYTLHCVIGGLISLSIKKAFELLFSKPKKETKEGEHE